MEAPKIRLSKLKSIFSDEAMEESQASTEMVIVEKPLGKEIILHVVNPPEEENKRIEIITKPRKGLPKDMIELAGEMVRSDGYMSTVFTLIPIPDYYLHCVFYGQPFTEDERYPTTNFSIVLIEFDGTIKTFANYEKFIDDAGLLIHKIPILHRGKARLDDIKSMVETSVLANDGVGVGCYIIFEPIYHAMSGNLMVFQA